ncbi:hypothetical protein FDECE_16407 [Fusarium decemcellulare]|nr:hypothetical protein FDECE_16407 [Fusarium decemcellulare]
MITTRLTIVTIPTGTLTLLMKGTMGVVAAGRGHILEEAQGNILPMNTTSVRRLGAVKRTRAPQRLRWLNTGSSRPGCEAIRVSAEPLPPTTLISTREAQDSHQREDPLTMSTIQPGQIFTIYWDLEYFLEMITQRNATNHSHFDEGGSGPPKEPDTLTKTNMRVFSAPYRPLGWANGYGDGGFRAGGRKYPVDWFLDRKFPDYFSFSWVPAKNIYPYDPTDTRLNEEFIRSVKDFLPRREAPREATVASDRYTPNE